MASSKNIDLRDVVLPVEVERELQNKALEYVESLGEFKSMAEEGSVYSAFLNGCRFMYINSEEFCKSK